MTRRSIGVIGRSIGIAGRTVGPSDVVPDSGVSRREFEQDVTDSWGDNDGTDNTSAGYVTGQVGSFVKEFNGADGYVELGNQLDADFAAPFSIAFWVNPNDNSTTQAVFDHDDTRIVFDITDRLTANFRMHWRIFDDSSVQEVAENSQLSTDAWNFYVGTYAEDGTMKLYKNDGNSQGTNSANQIEDTGAGSRFGVRTSGKDNYGGAIDDPRLYSKVLTSIEVSNLYNTGSISG